MRQVRVCRGLSYFGEAGVACCVPVGFGELRLGRCGEFSLGVASPGKAGVASRGLLRYVTVGCVGLRCGRRGKFRFVQVRWGASD